MDTDAMKFIKDEMYPKSTEFHSLFHDDTLRLLSAKLDPCDVVSLIYLMTDGDDANMKVYNRLDMEGQGEISAKTVDFPWICSELIPNWKPRIIEALVEIQLFDALLEVFGVNKLDAIYNVSVNDRILNPNKLKIFKVCDGLDAKQKQEFLDRMGQVLSRVNPSKANMPLSRFNYLEMYFMFWHMAGLIKPSGEGIEYILEGLLVTNSHRLTELFSTLEKLTVDDYTLAEYKIKNKDKVGLCIIVNQAQFDDIRNDRPGSAKDEASFQSVMESLNFDVVLRHNLSSTEMIPTIKETINTHFMEGHSVLFLTIMSHGHEYQNQTYVLGKDGEFTSTRKIVEMLFTVRRLNQVPKVLVICACRGPNTYTVTNLHIYESDGLQNESLRSDTMDIITVYSALPGFVSLRNIDKGSLFMQELCKVLKTRPDLEICELFTTVNKALMNPKVLKAYNPYRLAQPCEFTSRLLKKLHLKTRSND